MCDLLWADPQMPMGRAPSKRGVSCMFGPDVTAGFLDDNVGIAHDGSVPFPWDMKPIRLERGQNWLETEV